MSCQRRDGHRSHVNGKRGKPRYLAKRKERLVEQAKRMQERYVKVTREADRGEEEGA